MAWGANWNAAGDHRSVSKAGYCALTLLVISLG